MNLEDVYTKRVQGTQNSLRVALSSPFGSPTIERDPNLLKMESDVFSKLCKVVEMNDELNNRPASCNNSLIDNSQINFVSFEEAIRQLTSNQSK